MSTDATFMCDEIIKNLSGGKIGNPIKTPDEDGYDQTFGFEVDINGKTLHVWVQCDAEGNGPGWLDIEDAS